jgi:hypothetical protein
MMKKPPSKKLPKPLVDRLTAMMEETVATQTLERALEIEKLARQHGKATEKYSKLFKEFICDPAHGRVTVRGERYVFFKGETLSVSFLSILNGLFPSPDDKEFAANFGTNFLYDFGR